MLKRHLPVAGVAFLVALLVAVPCIAGPMDNPGATLALGWLADAAQDTVLSLPPAGIGAPFVRLEARWEEVERTPGVYDWTVLEPVAQTLHERGYRLALALTGSNPLYLPGGGMPSPRVAGSLEAWLQFVRSAVRSNAERVEVFEIGENDPARLSFDEDGFALLLKQSALAVRAEAAVRGSRVLVAEGALPRDGLAWQSRLWARDVAAYLDVLPVRVDAAEEPSRRRELLRALFDASLQHPPAPQIWVYVDAGQGWDAVEAAIASLAEGALVALAPGNAPEIVEQGPWIVGVQARLAAGYGPAPLAGLRIDAEPQTTASGHRLVARFFHPGDFDSLVVYRAPQDSTGVAARLLVDGTGIRDIRRLDPITGSTSRLSSESTPTGRAISLERGPGPGIVLYGRQTASPGLELPTEELEVASSRGLTAEEIIARHQQQQREQDDRLERWTARGRIDFHFQMAQGGASVDVSIESKYFWERGGHLEWEQTEYYVNGNRVRWKNIPELPLIQPEKVITLPLDLTLDKTYLYRLTGEDRVGDRSAYVLEFQPADPDSALSLYRGRVWIDRTNFARLKATVVQSQLEAPVLSNEETDRYVEQRGPDGAGYWLLDGIDGEQIWSAAGRSFVVRRELTFQDYEINPSRAGFEARRDEAYASSNQMLRDTSQGFRYLERQDDGSRIEKLQEDTSQLFAAAGVFKDNSRNNVIPLAGVNYFNYRLGGKDLQLNALFAGVLGFATLSKPDLFGRKVDLTVDAGLSGIRGEDRVYEGDVERLEQRVETRGQRLALRLGLPLGSFWKVNLIGGLGYQQYFGNDDASDRLVSLSTVVGRPLEFVTPRDHVELSGRLETGFNRRGYSVNGSVTRASRSAGEDWGLRDSSSLEFGTIANGVFSPQPAEPVLDRFTRFGATAAKEWYLPRFQKLRASLGYLDGSDLDRFSRYQFSFFGEDRLDGFSGSGVRFDRGVIGRAGYSFNLFEVLRLDAALEQARTRTDDVPGAKSFTGLGLSGSVVGPWKTVINLNYGYALDSDVPDLEGQQEFLLLVLKLF